jgi:hypothetical protein
MLRLILAFVLLLLAPMMIHAEPGIDATATDVTMYRQPFCSCCEGHAEHLRAHGFMVKVVETNRLSSLKKKLGVAPQFEGCHTIMIGGYIVEGHVPATVIRRLLKERPAIRGISLPGMPDGSPGMTGTKTGPFVIYELSPTGAVFATE